jgi:hypothetical protein
LSLSRLARAAARPGRPDLAPLERAGADYGGGGLRDELERQRDRRVWAAMVLALDVDTCRSILRSRLVRAGNLDGFVLRRALRGGRVPHAESYLHVSADMLDAVAEAGPLEPRASR